MRFLVEFRGWRLAFDRVPVTEPASADRGSATSYPIDAGDEAGEPHDVSFGFSPAEANSS